MVNRQFRGAPHVSSLQAPVLDMHLGQNLFREYRLQELWEEPLLTKEIYLIAFSIQSC